MKMTTEQLKGMNHYLISGFLDISPMTTSCEQVKKGNEEMIFHFLTAFFLYPSTPLFQRQAPHCHLEQSRMTKS